MTNLDHPSAAPENQAVAGTRVSVIVPTFNRAHYIGECIDSLLAQTVSPHEIIVIDDGSSDGTAELLSRYAGPVHYRRKENGGKPSAVNLGLTLASGDFVWVFDDDDVALPQAIASRLAVFEQDPSLDYVYSPHYLGGDDEAGRIRIGQLYEPPRHEAECFFRELMKGCFFHLGSTLVRRNAYGRIGGFDTQLLSSEDYDLQLRLAQHLRGAYCTTPSFVFRQHAGLRGAASIRYAAKDRAKVFRKFDQAVGRRLRRDVPLERFAPSETLDEAPQAAQITALLGRATVMASKACLSEMIDDIWAVCALSGAPQHALSANSIAAISDAICTGYAAAAVEADWPAFRRSLHPLKNFGRAGKSAIRAMALGFARLAKGYPGTISQRLTRAGIAVRLALIG